MSASPILLLVLISFISFSESCGNVQTSTSSTTVSPSSTTVTGGRKRRSAGISQLELLTSVDSEKISRSEELFSKIEELLSGEFPEIFSNSKTEAVERNGQIMLVYNFIFIDCDQVTQFAQSAQHTIDFVESMSIKCTDHE